MDVVCVLWRTGNLLRMYSCLLHSESYPTWPWLEWVSVFDPACSPVTLLGLRRSCCVLRPVSLSLQVLATGLSALYSSLPRKIEVQGDDWHALRREDWMGVSSLKLFMNSLEFCNAVVQVAHPLVRSQLLDYLHNGFLVPVMGPTLHTVGEVTSELLIERAIVLSLNRWTTL